MNTTRRQFAFSLGLLATGLAVESAHGQTYPERPIRFVVPYGAGATLDIVARLVGLEMAKVLGQPLVVDNKPGADAIIGLEYVAKQMPADGYTLVIAAVAGLATLPLTVKNLRFDPLADLPPVLGLVEGKYVFVASAKSGLKTFDDFLAQAKAKPGKLNYGASSTAVRLQSEALLHARALDVVYVPYRSGANYIQALGGGEIQVGFLSESSAISLGDRAHVLAVTGAARSDKFPDAPTFAQVGVKELRGVNYSLNVRAGTPRPIIEKLESAAQQALRQPAVRTQLAAMGLDPVAQPADVAARELADEARSFAEVAQRAGIQPV